MRKLQYVFMALAALCFAVPAFAQSGGSTAVNLVPIGAGIGMALAAEPVWPLVRVRLRLRLAKRWLATPEHAAA